MNLDAERDRLLALAEKKWWPFEETPGDFAGRLYAGMSYFGSLGLKAALLAAVRSVLIEDPPTSPLVNDFAALCRAQAAEIERLTKEANELKRKVDEYEHQRS